LIFYLTEAVEAKNEGRRGPTRYPTLEGHGWKPMALARKPLGTICSSTLVDSETLLGLAL